MSAHLGQYFDPRPSRKILNLPFSEYQAIPAVNASLLKAPTRLQMKAIVDGMAALPAADRALLELTGADASEVLARVEEVAPRMVPRHFVRFVTAPGALDKPKPSAAQLSLLDRCASGPVDAREFSPSTLRACEDRGWVETFVQEVSESLVAPSTAKTRAETLMIGQATHTAILEPHMFDSGVWEQHYQLAPGDNLTSKAALEAFAECPERQLITAEIIDTARRCRDAVWAHKEARHLLELPGKNEVTIESWDEEAGVMRKARLDCLPDDREAGIIDIKTCRNLGTRTNLKPLRDAVWKYGYHLQHAFYLDSLALIEGGTRRERWHYIWVTKEAPFMARVTECMQAYPEVGFYEPGRNTYLESLAEFVLGWLENDWSAFENEGAALLTARS